MCIINIFRSAYNDEHETLNVDCGKPLHEVIDADLDNAIISVNGFKKDKSYILCDKDVCTIRIFPAANDAIQNSWDWLVGTVITAGAFLFGGPAVGLVVGAIWFGGSAISYKVSGKTFLAHIMPDYEPRSTGTEQAKTLPHIRGGQNQSLMDKPIPFIMGRHLLTPYYCGKLYTQIEGADGEDQYAYILLMLGYSKLKVTDIKLGELLIASNNTNVLDNSNGERILLDQGLSNLAGEIELCQSDRECSLYPQKIYEEQLQIELTNVEGVKLESKRFSANNPHKVQVEITIPCLVRYNDKGDEEAASVSVNVQWRWHTLDGTDNWKNFPEFKGCDSYSNGTSKFTRKKNKQMRFVATLPVSYDDLPRIISDGKSIIDPVSMIDLNISRASENSTDSKIRHQVYLTAIRTWTYDYRKTEESKSMVIERPVDEIRRGVSSRLALKLKVTPLIQDQLQAINCVVESYARTWNRTTQQWSATEVTTRNPAAIALKALTSPMLGKHVLNDSKIDLEAFGKWYDFCNDEHYDDIDSINALNKRNCVLECNGVIYQQVKLSDLLESIMKTGRACYIRNGHKLSVVTDKARSQYVAILNNQNVISASNSKQFADIPDGVKVTFIDEDCGWQKNTMYVNFDDGTTQIKKDYEYFPMELPYQTHRNQVWHTAMIEQAKSTTRPEVWTRTVTTEGHLLGIMDLVLVQDDTIVVGIGDGAEIEGFEYDDSGKYIEVIKTDGHFNVADLSKEYGIKVMQADGVNEPVVRVYKVRIDEAGYISDFKLDTPLFIGEDVRPCIGDILAFGEYEREAIEAVVVGKKHSEDGKFEITLVPYTLEAYEYEKTRVMPVFDSKVNAPQPPAGIQTIPPSTPSYEDLNKVLSSIRGGTETDIPDTPQMVEAVATRDGINVSWETIGIGINNVIRHYAVEMMKTDKFESVGTVSDNSYTYLFTRAEDGFPEAGELQSWRFRVRAVNVYGNESEDWGGGEEGVPVNTDTYGTWQLSPPKIVPQVRDRHVTLLFSQPPRADNRQVYGNIQYEIWIRRPDVDTNPDVWYTPGTSLNPYPETADNGTEVTNVLNYKLNSHEPETRGEMYVQTMPLKGQGGDGKSIENTLYLFKVVARNEAGLSSATIVQATALCTNIVDLVNANLTQKEAYVPDLAAISANLGSINQGSMGNDNNRWDLSTFVDNKGVQRWEGLFRVGGDNQYFHVNPVINDIGQIVDYRIDFKVGKFELTSVTSNIKGEVIVMAENVNYERTRITPTGTYYEYKASDEAGWETVAHQTTSGLLSQVLYSHKSLLIANSTIESRRERGLDIGRVYLSENCLVYHFDTNFFDQHGTSPTPYTLDGTAQLVDASDNSPLSFIDFTPAIIAVAPYSEVGKSVYGKFSLTYPLGSPVNLALDFWVQFVWSENSTVFEYGDDTRKIRLISIVSEPFYNVPQEDEPPYNYEIDEIAELPFNVVNKMESYIQLERVWVDPDTGKNQFETKMISLEDYDVELVQNTWMHVGIGKDERATTIYINSKYIPITDRDFIPEAQQIVIGDKHSFQLDELMVDATVTLRADDFFSASIDKIPWGSLDYKERHLILDSHDPENVKGNVMDTVKRWIDEAQTISEPTGKIAMYIGLTAPPGYLVCNGSEYDVTDYPELAEVLLPLPFNQDVPYGRFRVPDMRGTDTFHGEMSDYEELPFDTSGTEMPYNGFLTLRIKNSDGFIRSVYVNDVDISGVSGGINGYTAQQNTTIVVNKGDIVRVSSPKYGTWTTYARWFKEPAADTIYIIKT